MAKLSPAHRKFLTKIAEPRRRERRFLARLEVDGHWQMFRTLRDMGMLMQHPHQSSIYIPTAQAVAAMEFEIPDTIAALWTMQSTVNI